MQLAQLAANNNTMQYNTTDRPGSMLAAAGPG
jgi:hypothetical protein